jgi:hypothetical protein
MGFGDVAADRRRTAPYMALLHYDDRWSPEFLARRVAFLERHPSCAMAFAGGQVIDEDGRLVRASSSR